VQNQEKRRAEPREEQSQEQSRPTSLTMYR
jgi:hypothetical protein